MHVTGCVSINGQHMVVDLIAILPPPAIYNRLHRVQSTGVDCKNGGKEENGMGLGLTDKTLLCYQGISLFWLLFGSVADNHIIKIGP